MPKTPRRSRTMSLREAASVVFALVALLPILLLVYLLSRHELMHSTEAQVGLLAAIGVSVLGFVVFRRMMDQISALAQGFIAPTEAKPETLRRVERASAVPGLGEVTEIGQIARAPSTRCSTTSAARPSAWRISSSSSARSTRWSSWPPASRSIQDLLGLVLQTHDARGPRHRRLDHAARPRAQGAARRPPPAGCPRGVPAGRGRGRRGHRRQGRGDGRGRPGRRHRDGSALRPAQRPPVRLRLLHLHADPGGRPRHRRHQPRQKRTAAPTRCACRPSAPPTSSSSTRS